MLELIEKLMRLVDLNNNDIVDVIEQMKQLATTESSKVEDSELKAKYDELKQNYIKRFMQGEKEDKKEEKKEEKKKENKEDITIDELFEEVKWNG